MGYYGFGCILIPTLYKNHYSPPGQLPGFTMASSPVDDARERAELGYALQALKHGRSWPNWPNPDTFEEGDAAPWWWAGLDYIHEILPSEADAVALQLASPVHLETHLYSVLTSIAEKLYADKLRAHDAPHWTDLADGEGAFKLWLVRESRSLIDSLVNKAVMKPATLSPPQKTTSQERKRLRLATCARVSKNLASLRAERGWSFDELALQSGVDRKLLMRCEHGGGMQPATKKKIADAFGISVAELEK